MSIQELSAETFRQKLAGLTDEEKKLPTMDQESIKTEAIRLCSILASLFSDDLDRKTLWERIGTGLVAAIAKANHDLDRFVNFALDYIQADPGRVAASEPLTGWLETNFNRPIEWQQGLLRYIDSRRYIVLVKARAHWMAVKEKREEL